MTTLCGPSSLVWTPRPTRTRARGSRPMRTMTVAVTVCALLALCSFVTTGAAALAAGISADPTNYGYGYRTGDVGNSSNSSRQQDGTYRETMEELSALRANQSACSKELTAAEIHNLTLHQVLQKRAHYSPAAGAQVTVPPSSVTVAGIVPSSNLSESASKTSLDDLRQLAADADARVRSAATALQQSTAMLEAREASRMNLGPLTLAQHALLANHLAEEAALAEMQLAFIEPVARFVDAAAATLSADLVAVEDLLRSFAGLQSELDSFPSVLAASGAGIEISGSSPAPTEIVQRSNVLAASSGGGDSGNTSNKINSSTNNASESDPAQQASSASANRSVALWSQNRRNLFFAQRSALDLHRNLLQWASKFSHHRCTLDVVVRSFQRTVQFRMQELSRLSAILDGPQLARQVHAGSLLAAGAASSLSLAVPADAEEAGAHTASVTRVLSGYRRLFNVSTARTLHSFQVALAPLVGLAACLPNSPATESGKALSVAATVSFLEERETATSDAELAAWAIRPKSAPRPSAKNKPPSAPASSSPKTAKPPKLPLPSRTPKHGNASPSKVPITHNARTSTSAHVAYSSHAAHGGATKTVHTSGKSPLRSSLPSDLPKQVHSSTANVSAALGGNRNMPPKDRNMPPKGPTLDDALQELLAVNFSSDSVRTLTLPKRPDLVEKLSGAQRSVAQTSVVAARIATQLTDAVLPIEQYTRRVDELADETARAVKDQRSTLERLLSDIRGRLGGLVANARQAVVPFQSEGVDINPMASIRAEIVRLGGQLRQERATAELLGHSQTRLASALKFQTDLQDRLVCSANSSARAASDSATALSSVVVEAEASSKIARMVSSRAANSGLLLSSASVFDQTKGPGLEDRQTPSGASVPSSSDSVSALQRKVKQAMHFVSSALAQYRSDALAALTTAGASLRTSQEVSHNILKLDTTIADVLAEFEAQRQANVSTSAEARQHHIGNALRKRRVERVLGAPVVQDQVVDTEIADPTNATDGPRHQHRMDDVAWGSILDSIDFLRSAASELTSRALGLYELQRVHCHTLAGAMGFFAEAEQVEGVSDESMRRAVDYLNRTASVSTPHLPPWNTSSRPLQSAVAVVLASGASADGTALIQNTLRECSTALPLIFYHLNLSMVYRVKDTAPPSTGFSEDVVRSAVNRTAALSGILGQAALADVLKLLTSSHEEVSRTIGEIERVFSQALEDALQTQALRAKADAVKIRFAKILGADAAIRASVGSTVIKPVLSAPETSLFDASLILAMQEDAGTGGFVERASATVVDVVKFSQRFVHDAISAFSDAKSTATALHSTSSPAAMQLEVASGLRTATAHAMLRDVSAIASKNESLQHLAVSARTAAQNLRLLDDMQQMFEPVIENISRAVHRVSEPVLDRPDTKSAAGGSVNASLVVLGKCHAVSVLDHFLTPALARFDAVRNQARTTHDLFSSALTDIQKRLTAHATTLEMKISNAREEALRAKVVLDQLARSQSDSCASVQVFRAAIASPNPPLSSGTALSPESTVLQLAMQSGVGARAGVNRHLKLIESHRCADSHFGLAAQVQEYKLKKLGLEELVSQQTALTAVTSRAISTINELMKLDMFEQANLSSSAFSVGSGMMGSLESLRGFCSNEPIGVPLRSTLAQSVPLKTLVEDVGVFSREARLSLFEGSVVRNANFEQLFKQLAQIDADIVGPIAAGSSPHASSLRMSSRLKGVLESRDSFEGLRRKLSIDLDHLQLACALSAEYVVFVDNLVLTASINSARAVARAERESAHHIQRTVGTQIFTLVSNIGKANAQTRNLLQTIQLEHAVPIVDELERNEYFDAIDARCDSLADGLLYLLNDHGGSNHANVLATSIMTLSGLWSEATASAKAAMHILTAQIQNLQRNEKLLSDRVHTAQTQEMQSLRFLSSAVGPALSLLNDTQLSALFGNDTSVNLDHVHLLVSELRERMGMLKVVVSQLERASAALRDHYNAAVAAAHKTCGVPGKVRLTTAHAQPKLTTVASTTTTVSTTVTPAPKTVQPCLDNGLPCSAGQSRYAPLYILEPLIDEDKAPPSPRPKHRSRRRRRQAQEVLSFLEVGSPNSKNPDSRFNMSHAVSSFKSCAAESLAVANALSAYQHAQIDFKAATDQWKSLAEYFGAIDAVAQNYSAVNESLLADMRALGKVRDLLGHMVTTQQNVSVISKRAEASLQALKEIVHSPSVQLRNMSTNERLDARATILRVFGLDIGDALMHCTGCNISRQSLADISDSADLITRLTAGDAVHARAAFEHAVSLLRRVHNHVVAGHKLDPKILTQISNVSKTLKARFSTQTSTGHHTAISDMEELSSSILDAVTVCVDSLQPIRHSFVGMNSILREAEANTRRTLSLQVRAWKHDFLLCNLVCLLLVGSSFCV
eukprot:INCI13072.3.p1 GENE.INCI13072.3~~INCI13072.3.p1  ORF type:complete len:2396 (-),score=436.70 INCI13072.3:695-7882(-)